MKTVFRRSFLKDVRDIRDGDTRRRVLDAIEHIELADRLHDVPGVTKLSGHPDAFRIRIGDYRIGLYLEDDTIEFVRCLHRRDIYRFFP